ncbi:hypothetical protein NKI54_05800 [Mesorhizobium sp. M0663]|uniref:hypothetical protein n=1 Tax=Mesorhizobium sp. M0663 TaxID=2956981 RepID=UPI00333B1014
MAKIETPIAGGAYNRHKDGTLERIEGTEPAPPPGTEAEPAPAGTDEPLAAETGAPRKGK